MGIRLGKSAGIPSCYMTVGIARVVYSEADDGLLSLWQNIRACFLGRLDALHRQFIRLGFLMHFRFFNRCTRLRCLGLRLLKRRQSKAERSYKKEEGEISCFHSLSVCQIQKYGVCYTNGSQ